MSGLTKPSLWKIRAALSAKPSSAGSTTSTPCAHGDASLLYEEWVGGGWGVGGRRQSVTRARARAHTHTVSHTAIPAERASSSRSAATSGESCLYLPCHPSAETSFISKRAAGREQRGVAAWGRSVTVLPRPRCCQVGLLLCSCCSSSHQPTTTRGAAAILTHAQHADGINRSWFQAIRNSYPILGCLRPFLFDSLNRCECPVPPMSARWGWPHPRLDLRCLVLQHAGLWLPLQKRGRGDRRGCRSSTSTLRSLRATA